MCGIAGILNLTAAAPPEEGLLRSMLGTIRHRGPDEYGMYLDDAVGLGNARLSIIDLSGGQQPIPNEDRTLWIVFNGEIFNYVELRPELEARGHRFETSSDTEVLLHLYEEFGPAGLERLNGQWAFAVWNSRDKSLFLARDRLGVRPLFYTQSDHRLLFGSEIKTLLADRRVRAEIDLEVLEQVFTFWSPLASRSIFRGISEVPPGHYLMAAEGKMTVRPYWQPNFPTAGAVSQSQPASVEQVVEEFSSLLVDAAKIRLRADVPVGAYLSGGLDSSIISAIIRKFTTNRLDTFSIAFTDVDFDESKFQRQMAQFLGTEHQVVEASHEDIGRVFPEVIWHTEVPIMRTAPAPMFLLSKLVRDSGYKVVLTGEGADEFLAGYDIFKEAKVRRFWGEQPESKWRPLLFQRLYPDITNLTKSSPAYLKAFFGEGVANLDAPYYSHAIRWRNNRRACRFFAENVGAELARRNTEITSQVGYPSQFKQWEPLAQAQFLEITVFLSQYLLSSQGDRMGMAHSIEGRFPFLDCRLVEFCNRLPARLKLRGLTEKFLLKQLGRRWLPDLIWQRPKRPYRAPIHRSFFHGAPADYVLELLSPKQVAATGLFKPQAVDQLVQKVRRGSPLGETDDMALAGILSTQLVHQQFIERFTPGAPISERDRVKVCRPSSTRPASAAAA